MLTVKILRRCDDCEDGITIWRMMPMTRMIMMTIVTIVRIRILRMVIG